MVNKKILLAISACAMMLVACGDDESEISNTNTEAYIDFFENGGSLSKLSCDSSNKGKMIFVKDSSAIFFCDGRDWVSANKGLVDTIVLNHVDTIVQIDTLLFDTVVLNHVDTVVKIDTLFFVVPGDEKKESLNVDSIKATLQGKDFSKKETDENEVKLLKTEKISSCPLDTNNLPEEYTLRKFDNGWSIDTVDQRSICEWDGNQQYFRVSQSDGTVRYVALYKNGIKTEEQWFNQLGLQDSSAKVNGQRLSIKYYEDGIRFSVLSIETDGSWHLTEYADLIGSKITKQEYDYGITELYSYDEEGRKIYYKSGNSFEHFYVYGDKVNYERIIRLEDDMLTTEHWDYLDDNGMIICTESVYHLTETKESSCEE